LNEFQSKNHEFIIGKIYLQKVFAGNFSLFAGKIICRNFLSLFAGKSVFAVIPANKKFICRKFYLQ